MSNVTISSTDWEALVGAVLKEETSELTILFDKVDKANSLTRYYMWVKWLDTNAPRPGPDDPAEDYPPWRTEWFVQYSAITRTFIEEYVASVCSKPIYIMVTDDPAGEVGWHEIDEYF